MRPVRARIGPYRAVGPWWTGSARGIVDMYNRKPGSIEIGRVRIPPWRVPGLGLARAGSEELGRSQDPRYATLSPQERRILDLITSGLTNPEIAEQVHLAEKTVKNYLSSVLRKLGVAHRTEAAVYATRRQQGGAPEIS